jgi:hypothetical protein
MADDVQAPDTTLVAAEGEVLTAGWEDDVPDGDSLLLAAVRNHVAQVRALGASPIYDVLDVPGVAAAASGLPEPMTNVAILTAPLERLQGQSGLAALEDFAAEHPGTPMLAFSPYSTADLSSRGHSPVGHPPLMVRMPGGPAPRPPTGVTIEEVADEHVLTEWERVLIEGYPTPSLADLPAPAAFSAELLGGGWRFWLARDADGDPLATAGAMTAAGVQVVSFVATLPTARSRGIGAAITATAGTGDPDLPAMLIASDLGRPVYERLGYVTMMRISLWVVIG